MSLLFDLAAQQYRRMRQDYELILEAAYALAEHECNGYLLNRRGQAADIDPYSLFMGNETRALAYASEELIEHWGQHPRITFADYERQHLETDWNVA